MREPGDPAVSRIEDDDYDLLTYAEAGARLTEEIARQRQLVAQLEQRDDTAGRGAGRDATAARGRLELLLDAARRNSRRQINENNFEQFFGFKSRPRS